MKHQISIGSWAFIFGPFEKNPWDFAKVLQWTKEAGYDGIEISGFRPHPNHDDYDTPEKCWELAELVSSYGLGISGYAPDLMQVPPAEVSTEQYMSVFHRSLQFCRRCGIGTIRVDTVSPPDVLSPAEYERRFTRLTATCRAASLAAEQAGVRFVWEFEPGFWLNKPSEVKHLIEAVNHPNFQILFDPSHAYMGAVVGARQTGEKEILPGGVVEYAQLLAPYIGHFHLIDSDGTLHGEETSTHTPFGEGHIDFKQLMRSIRPVISKLPWWGVDYCFHAGVEQDGRKAVPFIRDLIKEVF
jgi:sugar phosphate isomerase/epimerase